MDDWLLYSLASCFLYSLWTIFSKLASRTIDSTTSSLMQLPIRTVVTILTAIKKRKPSSPGISLNLVITQIGQLSLYGSLYTVLSCISSVFATFFFGDALQAGGNASSVAVITGSYPAVSYIISVMFGLESINFIKLLGVLLAIGSCYCFAIAT